MLCTRKAALRSPHTWGHVTATCPRTCSSDKILCCSHCRDMKQKQGQNHNIYPDKKSSRDNYLRDMLQRHAPATCPLVCADNFWPTQHKFSSNFVPGTCYTEFNWLNFVGHVAEQNVAEMRWLLVWTDSFAACP